MTPDDFRRIALSFPGAEEGAHMGAADFRVGGRIFATLAAQAQGMGMVQLPAEQQEMVCAAEPDLFRPVPGGWGRMGCTHAVLAAADEPTLTSAMAKALATEWRRTSRSGKGQVS